MKNILLVDDDYNALSLFSMMLEKEGYACTCCSCCNSALNSIPQKPFSLVISDVRMPGNDGLHLLKQIKQDYRDVKVMMMSVETLEMEDLYLLGAIDFFNKLDGKDKLMEKIRRIEQEKRFSRRFSAEFKFRAGNVPATALNFSSDGILFEGQEQFKPNSFIDISLVSKADTLNIKGKVVRSLPQGPECRTAIYFKENIGPFLHKNQKSLV
jgi:CheY-like chemotaxis protein